MAVVFGPWSKKREVPPMQVTVVAVHEQHDTFLIHEPATSGTAGRSFGPVNESAARALLTGELQLPATRADLLIREAKANPR
jgi:hypothetical protein